MRRPVQLLIAAVCVLAVASACTTEDPTANTNIPLVPTQPVVDTFQGTVSAGGKDTKIFSVTQGNGGLDITLTSLVPSTVIEIGAGTWDGTTCTLATNGTRNVSAGASPQLSFLQVSIGTYCVQVIDVGNLMSTATYNLTVAHY
ncbi:MAG TPA: hypothetical protein VFA27_14165 [Vicinamibacterales bacterium]|nr:hypothetical protein [Vicinamibacterales bacterium]